MWVRPCFFGNVPNVLFVLLGWVLRRELLGCTPLNILVMAASLCYQADVKLAGFRSQLESFHLSRYTDELWYILSVDDNIYIYIYIYEDLPRAMNDREEWRERVRDIRATSAIWWWWYIYIFQALALSITLYGCITCMEKSLDGNFTRMLRSVRPRKPPSQNPSK